MWLPVLGGIYDEPNYDLIFSLSQEDLFGHGCGLLISYFYPG